MKFSTVFALVILTLFLSGCTVAQFTYIRNLCETDVQITFVFNQDAAPSLRDSLFIPSSPTSHLINNTTFSLMKDSLIARKVGMTQIRLVLPSGAMIMLDKNTSRKVGYHDPSVIEIAIPQKQVKYEVVAGSPGKDQKQFKTTGAHNRIYWHDIY